MKNIGGRLTKSTVLLVLSLGLFWFLGQFPPATLFEPFSTGWTLWASYANDLILPFALYFFLCLNESWLNTWQRRALFVLTIFMLLEFGQAFYYRVAPSIRYTGSFDPLDIVMYTISVGLAVIVEQQVFAKRFKFWQQ
jgi:hypothetical protein